MRVPLEEGRRVDDHGSAIVYAAGMTAPPENDKKRGFLRRNAGRIVGGVVVLVVGFVGVGWLRFQKRLGGPPLPSACQGAPLVRKTFGKPVQVTSAKSVGTYANEPGASLLPDGTLALAFQAHDGFFSDNLLGLATIDVSGKVTEGSLGSDRKRHFDAWMTTDPSGMLHLVWFGHNGRDKHSQIAYAQSKDGLSWSSPVEVNDTATDCPGDVQGCLDKPMIAWMKDGPLVTYYSTPGGGLKAVRLKDGKPEGPSVPVGGAAYGDVDVSSSGTVHVVYSMWDDEKADSYGDARIRIEYVRSVDGGKSFDKPIRVSGEGEPVPFFFSNAQVAADDGRGIVYVVYPAGTGSGQWEIMLATSKDAGKTWSRIRVNDDAPCANHMTPSVALDPKTGVLHVIWLENRTGKGGVAYAACEAGGEKCSANEAVSEAPFASYRFSRHQTDWLGEYGALVVDAERRTLHAVWAQPVDEGGEAVSRIFVARAEL